MLRVHDAYVATYWAAALNAIIALMSFALAARVPAVSETNETVGEAAAGEADEAPDGRRVVFASVAISGACALGAEVVWTRLMGMMLGATVYVFSIILAVFLIGLAAGSGVAAMLLRSMKPRLVKARRALGWCQMFAGAGRGVDRVHDRRFPALLAHRRHADAEPVAIVPARYGAGDVGDLAGDAVVGRELSRWRCAAMASVEEDHGRTVGAVYAANTLGAIVGALGVSLVLVPWIGTQNSQRVLLLAAAVGALVALAP